MPSRSASTGESSTTWRGAQELQRGRDVDLLGAPQRAERAEAQRALGRAGGGPGRHLELDRLPAAGQRRGGAPSRGPAHAAPADRVEREPGVERHRVEQLLEAIGPVSTPRSSPTRRRDVADDLPQRPHAGAGPPGGAARAPDRRPQALHAPVGVRERALLLGVGLGGEDDVGVLADRVAEHGVDARSRSGRCRAPTPTARGPGACAAGRRGAARPSRGRRRRAPRRCRAHRGRARRASRSRGRGRGRSPPRARRARSSTPAASSRPAPSRPASPSRARG